MASVTDRARLIDVLLRAGANLGRDDAGRLVSAKVPPELVATVAELATDLELGVAGAAGVRYLAEGGKATTRRYRWCRCTHCGHETLTRASGAACALTPGCKGKARPMTDPEPLLLDGQPIACARPRCGRPAVVLTAGHEPVCRSDFVHLAAHLHHHGRTP